MPRWTMPPSVLLAACCMALALGLLGATAAPAAADSHVTLYQAYGRGEVWHVGPEWHRHWIPTLAVFEAKGWSWADVTRTSQAVIDAHPVGRAYVTSGSPDGLAHCRAAWRDGCLYRTPADGRVYLYDGGVRWVQTLETFNGLGLWWDAVVDLDPRDSLPAVGPPITLGLAPASGPTPGPAPAPGPTLPNHPDAALVRDTAIARGAPADQAVAIAADVIGRGAVEAFLHGTDAGVVYGVADCQWRSPQCPRAPERPPEPKSPREAAAALVDPALMPALELLNAVFDAYDLDGDTYTFTLIAQLGMTVRCGSAPAGAAAAFWEGNRSRSPRILINAVHCYEHPRALVPTLAHELWHALGYATGRSPRTYEGCLREEFLAESAAAGAWALVRPGPRARLTSFEQQHEWTYQHWVAGTLESNVRDRYWERCAA